MIGSLRTIRQAFLSLTLSLAALGLIAVSEARAADNPIVGTWKWFVGPDVTFKANKTIHIDGKKVGSWQAGGKHKYKGKTYTYKLSWDKGGADDKPHIDYLNLAKDKQKLEGVNTEGAEVSGERK